MKKQNKKATKAASVKFEGVNNGATVIRFQLSRDEFFGLARMATRDKLTPGKEAQSIIRAALADNGRKDGNGGKGTGTEAASAPQSPVAPKGAWYSATPILSTVEGGEDGPCRVAALDAEEWETIKDLARKDNVTMGEEVRRILSNAARNAALSPKPGIADDGRKDGDGGQGTETEAETETDGDGTPIHALLPSASFFQVLGMATAHGVTPGEELQRIILKGLQTANGDKCDDGRKDGDGDGEAGTEAASAPQAEVTEAASVEGGEVSGPGETASAPEAESDPLPDSPDYWAPRLTVDDWNNLIELADFAKMTPAKVYYCILSSGISSAMTNMKTYKAKFGAGDEGDEGKARDVAPSAPIAPAAPSVPSVQPLSSRCKPIPPPPTTGLILQPFLFCENGEQFDKTGNGDEIALSIARFCESSPAPFMVRLSFEAAIRPLNLLRKDGQWCLAFDLAPVCQCGDQPAFAVKVGAGGDIPLETALALLGGDYGAPRSLPAKK